MPELPEVETIRRGLEKVLVGQTVKSVDVRVPKLFIGQLEVPVGQEVIEVSRRAKILIIKLSRSYLLVHLKMTGQLIYVPKKGQIVLGGHPDKVYSLSLPHKHSHIIFQFDHGTLYYNDLRKFGWIKALDSADKVEKEVAHFGPEYTWPEFSLEYFGKKLAKRPAITIKQALLDQTVVAGIGNIYADESLFCAKVLPTRKVKDLTATDTKAIYQCISEVLNLSLSHGGTSAKDYRQVDGSMGTFLAIANVYKREKLPCKICGTPIKRIKISGRSSHFCPNCQE